MDLTGKQKKYLRGLAHSLKPVVHVGKDGLSAAVRGELSQALDHHELIKVRLAGDRHERKELAGEIENELECAVAGSVGAVAILYRPHTDPEQRQIHL
ncbi:MAG: ribosome assembly RNA-binding protein YhbY [Acidobacteriota bacterium]